MKQIQTQCLFVFLHLKTFQAIILKYILQRKRKHKLESILDLTFSVYFVNIQK